MAPYLDKDAFAALTVMPSGDVDLVEAAAPGWIDRKLAAKSRWIDALLAKRYEVPFVAPYPDTVTDWLARIVTLAAFLRRGVDPNDEQFVAIKADAEAAEAEIREAAASEEGLFELPLRADLTTTGVSKGDPFVYSEASPYVGFDLQRDTGRDEDRNGGGSYG
jgi:hypothetical protein